MTPYQLSVLMHYHVSPAPFQHNGSPLYAETVKLFADQGVFIPAGKAELFNVTDLGMAWIKMILDTPFPEKGFIDPRTNQIVMKAPS